jgi:hypothetical protein
MNVQEGRGKDKVLDLCGRDGLLNTGVNPFAPAAKSLSDQPENLHMGWKKIKNKNTF